MVFQVANLDDLIGTVLQVKFLEIEEERERLVFSARKAANDKDMKSYKVSLNISAVFFS